MHDIVGLLAGVVGYTLLAFRTRSSTPVEARAIQFEKTYNYKNSNAARLWRSEYRSKDSEGSSSVSPDFGIYTGPVNVLDIGDSHLIEFWPENNSIRLFGSESIQYIEKAIDLGCEIFLS